MSGRGRGRGRGRAPPGAAGRVASRTFVRPVGELARIHITDALDAFRRDASDTELLFPSDVDNPFRAAGHAQRKTTGLKSQAYG